MKSLVQYWSCGTTRVDSKNPAIYFYVTKFSDILDKIIPFFEAYPLQGSKKLDFADFCKVAELIKKKAH